MMTEIKKQTEKGFTLIELMIVVAIIGILAAIAIPQFSAYRIKAFNSAAQSDLRNLKLAEEGLYADYQSYGTTNQAATSAVAVGVAAVGTPLDGANLVAGNSAFVSTATAGQSGQISLSNNVLARADVDAAAASAILVTEHRQGDRAFAMDTDTTTLFYAANPLWVGLPAAGTSTLNATVPVVVAGIADIVNGVTAAAGAAPAAAWTTL